MPKKKTAKRDQSTRIDLKRYGIDLEAIIDEIRPHLEGTTSADIAAKAGDMTPGSVRNTLNGSVKPSLGAVAALAHAAGGRIVVRYEPARTHNV